MIRKWDAKTVSVGELDRHLDEGWEPIGVTEVHPMAGGSSVAWALRRRVAQDPGAAKMLTEAKPEPYEIGPHEIVVMKMKPHE